MPDQIIRLPLLHDHHSHPLLYASLGAALSLESVSRKQDAMGLLEKHLASSEGSLALAYGWRSNQFQWTDADLEQFGPLAIFNLSLHALVMNRAGADVLRDRYGDDVDKVSDQVWYENNFRRVLNWFANLNASAKSLNQFFDHLLTMGVYSVEELLLVDEEEIDLFREAGLLERTKFWAAPDTFDALSASAQDHVAGIKLFTDGALGARSAAISQHYLGEPENRGMLVYSDQQLERTVEQSLEQKNALAIHAIGDVAIQQVVATLEKVDRVGSAKKIRIEHAQLIDLETARRCKSLGVTLSMQPNFSSDSIHYRDRLSESFCQQNNPFRMLIDEADFVPGEDLIFGSDGMPHGIESAARQCFLPQQESQRVTPDEFAAAYGCGDLSRGSIDLGIGGRIRFQINQGKPI